MQAPAARLPSRVPLGLLGLTLLVGVGLAAPPAAKAQEDLRYKTITTTEYAGFMGTAMRMSGENMGPDTTTSWIKGLKRREDQGNGKASWIIDLETMDMTRWDHEDESYWMLNFQQFIQSADSSRAEIQGEMTDEDRAMMNSFEPSLEVDRTGETRMIDGWEAERVIMTMKLEASQDEMSEEDMEQDPMAAMMGTSAMVMLSDMWISDDLPGYEQMQEALGDQAQDFAAGSGGMESLMAGYPQMAALSEQMQEEMEGLDGQTVLSTMYLLMMPSGGVLNRDSILEMSDEPLPQGPDMSELMAQAMGNAGEDAAMDAVNEALGGLGGLGGLLGGRGGDDEKDEEQDQAELMAQGASMGGPQIMSRIVSRILDVERVTLSDADFQPPSGYRERDRPGGS